MAYTAVPTYVTGDLITAAHGNTYWRDNFAYLYSEINGKFPVAPADTTFFEDSNLYSGRVLVGGAAGKLPSGWSSSRPSTGKYRVTHNLGVATYTVVAMAEARFATWITRAANYFEIQIYGHDNGTGDMIVQNAAFDFILVLD